MKKLILLKQFSYSQSYNLHCSPVMGLRGAVATSHPLVVQAGMRMLLQGGNAVDAAITKVAVSAKDGMAAAW